MKKILLTGGLGYIGSHTSVLLLEAGFEIIILDNLSNSTHSSIDSIKILTSKTIRFYEGDIRDRYLLRSIFTENSIDAVIHFAALKSVNESICNPLKYYDNNVCGSISLFEVMAEFGCKKLVFSSSATVYGDSSRVPVSENFPLSTTNPYGSSKLIIEGILQDLSKSNSNWSVVVLRYFNPVGAHPSGLIGENPSGIPNNLMPIISQVAIGKRDKLLVYGNDYPTHDGTGVRDYIHVMDLTQGHLDALNYIKNQTGLFLVNLGTGKGYSVLDVIKAFEKASGKAVPFEVVARRSGDVAQCYADPSYAFELFGWKSKLGLEKMCEDYWRWQIKNENGYFDNE